MSSDSAMEVSAETTVSEVQEPCTESAGELNETNEAPTPSIIEAYSEEDASAISEVVSSGIHLLYLLYRLLSSASWVIFWLFSEVVRSITTAGRRSLDGILSEASLQQRDEDPSRWTGQFEFRKFVSRRPSTELSIESLWQIADEVHALLGNDEVVRISAPLRDTKDRKPITFAVFGTDQAVDAASKQLQHLLPLKLEDRGLHRNFFVLHFTMRRTWDLPQEDELVDAALEQDWVDLGTSLDEGLRQSQPKEAARSPAAVLRERLCQALPECGDLHVFMDGNPWETDDASNLCVDFAGPLDAKVWDAATQTILACEASGVYLSKHCGVRFGGADDTMRASLQEQVTSALSHWKGTEHSSVLGFGLDGMGFGGFEDLAANISAVLRGATVPGWHRLEWTPDGADALPHMTY